MRDGWDSVALGSVASQVRTRQAPRPDETYRLLGVRAKARGAFLRETVSGATTKAVALTPVRSGQFIYNRLFAGTGSFAVVPEELDGAWVSNEFPVFDVDHSRVDVRFLGLVFEQPDVWAIVASQCIGTTGSRMRWHESMFARFVVDLPPLAEQRRIVDLTGIFDEAIAAAEQTARCLVQSRRAAILDVAGSREAEAVPLNDVLAHVIGGAWGEPAGASDVDVNALNLLVFNSRALTVDPRFSSRRSLSRSRLETRSIEAGDILLERSGGTDDQPVGRVVYANSALPGVVPTDFMRLLRVDTTVAEPRYVFWWLWARYQDGDTQAFQSKTTNIRNLRVKDYLALPIPLPDRADQRAATALGESFTATIGAADRVASRLATLRAAVLRDLLSGDHAIPSSYDRFLDGAA
jgi:type I restriction enzyme S subunit